MNELTKLEFKEVLADFKQSEQTHKEKFELLLKDYTDLMRENQSLKFRLKNYENALKSANEAEISMLNMINIVGNATLKKF